MRKFIKPYTFFFKSVLRYKNVFFAYALLPYFRRMPVAKYKYIKSLKKNLHLFANDGELLQKLMLCNYINTKELGSKNPHIEVQYNNQNIKINIKTYDSIKVAEEIFIKFLYNFNSIEEMVVCDVGMNIGVASFPNIKKVYGFEPFPATFNLAEENFKLNQDISSKIIYHNYGLGKTNSLLNVQLPANGHLGGTTSTFFYDHLPKHGANKTITVTIKEAANVIQKIRSENPNHKIVLKLDCEGAEYDIIDNLCDIGIIDTISSIFMEYHFKGKQSLVTKLSERGFIIFSPDNDCISPFGMLYAFKK